MMAQTLDSRPGSLVTELTKLAEPHRERLLIAALIALGAHAGFGLYAANREPQAGPARPPVEVEFTLREPPPPPPEMTEESEPSKAEAQTPETKLAAPPPAARAGAVMTAAPDPTPEPATASAFDFTSDPTSHVYGSGVVAVGGTAKHGLTGARVGGTGSAPIPLSAPPAPPGSGLTAASDLSQRPRLRAADPCRGFFPEGAHDDVAMVSVRVVIGKNGRVSNANVVSESPLGQGFGAAARRCMLDQTFAPALDRDGNTAATAVNVNVKFNR